MKHQYNISYDKINVEFEIYNWKVTTWTVTYSEIDASRLPFGQNVRKELQSMYAVSKTTLV